MIFQIPKFLTLPGRIAAGISLLMLLALLGCNQDVMFDQSFNFSDETWNRSEKPAFALHVTDTVKPIDFLVNIRHNNDYPYANLFLFINTRYPNGALTRDTVEILMAKPNGEWLGEGFGKLKRVQVLLKHSVVFQQTGEYTFQFEQAMRTEALSGIEDFGITIQKIMQDN